MHNAVHCLIAVAVRGGIGKVIVGFQAGRTNAPPGRQGIHGGFGLFIEPGGIQHGGSPALHGEGGSGNVVRAGCTGFFQHNKGAGHGGGNLHGYRHRGKGGGQYIQHLGFNHSCTFFSRVL